MQIGRKRLDPRHIPTGNATSRMQQALGQLSVTTEQQQTGRLGIESADGVEHPVPWFRQHTLKTGTSPRISQRGHNPPGLVPRHHHGKGWKDHPIEPQLRGLGHTKRGFSKDLAIDVYTSMANGRSHLSPATGATLGQQPVEANHQTVQIFSGRIGDPTGQSKASPNEGSCESGPFTRNLAGLCGSVVTRRRSASGRMSVHHP